MRMFRYFADFEKEEKWLNEMAKQGWELTGKSFGYYFSKIVPDDTNIKIDYRTFKTARDFEDYLMLFKDSGWEHIAGTKTSGVQYFKKVSGNGETEIFSDIPSKAARYKRLSNMWLSLAVSYIPIFTALAATNTIDASVLLNPKLLYYTPGLWEKTGVSFWGAFLFETPFAIMRGFAWLLFPVMIMLFLIFAAKAEKQYRTSNAEQV